MPPFDLPALLQQYGYWALAAGTFLEGETMLALAGWAAHEGYLSLGWVIVIATVCGTLGDQFFFLLGEYFGPRIMNRFPKMRPKAERVHALMRRYDALTIVSVRFLYGLRIAGPITIGMSGIHWARFALFNLGGALLWAVGVSVLGYTLGHTVELFVQRMLGVQKAALVSLLLALGLVRIVFWWRARKPAPS